MKRLIFFVAIFLFFQNKNLLSQNQFFPINSASWEEANIGFSGIPIPDYIVQCGDSLINEKTYAKMYSLQLDDMGNETSRNYIGGTRRALDLVYFFQNGGTEEYLLYDFSLETGQTITVQTIFGMNNLTVGSNELINTPDGVTRRLIHFVNSNNTIIETWTEGIGSNLGVINRGIDLNAISDFFPYLNCFKYEGNLGWENLTIQPTPDCTFTFSEVCESTPNRNLKLEEKINFEVLPNPFSENSVVEFQNLDQLKQPILTIYNFQGQIVEKIIGINEEKFTFPRKNLNAGVYVFELTDGKTTFATRKKIIIY